MRRRKRAARFAAEAVNWALARLAGARRRSMGRPWRCRSHARRVWATHRRAARARRRQGAERWIGGARIGPWARPGLSRAEENGPATAPDMAPRRSWNTRNGDQPPPFAAYWASPPQRAGPSIRGLHGAGDPWPGAHAVRRRPSRVAKAIGQGPPTRPTGWCVVPGAMTRGKAPARRLPTSTLSGARLSLSRRT
jgi:hypothetical protein